MTKKVKTPELDRISAVHKESQACGEFLEWLQAEKGIVLCRPHKHDKGCESAPGEWLEHSCGIVEGRPFPIFERISSLLAAFFGIDEGKAERERVILLESIRRRA